MTTRTKMSIYFSCSLPMPWGRLKDKLVQCKNQSPFPASIYYCHCRACNCHQGKPGHLSLPISTGAARREGPLLDQKPVPRRVWQGSVLERHHFYPSNSWNKLINSRMISRAILLLQQPFHIGFYLFSCKLCLIWKACQTPHHIRGRGRCAAWK